MYMHCIYIHVYVYVKKAPADLRPLARLHDLHKFLGAVGLVKPCCESLLSGLCCMARELLQNASLAF